MKSPWLVIDVSNLAYRAFHAMKGQLSHGGDATEVVFGVFRDIIELRDLWTPKGFVFCFDGGYIHRTKILPEYKAERKAKKDRLSPEERVLRRDLAKQVDLLRNEYLPRIGFANILWQDGVEADDLIAEVCWGWRPAVIVSSDQDLWQLLFQDEVVIWNPMTKLLLNESEFIEKWGIPPNQWADVKAISGCKTDGVVGIEGVGEVGASQFIAGTLAVNSKKAVSIVRNVELWKKNLKVTKLPGPWTNEVELVPDEINRHDWNEVMNELGMRSFVGEMA